MKIHKIDLKFKNPLIPIQKIENIIIHHSGEIDWTIYQIHSFHQNERGWDGVGYNYFIDEKGEIFEGRGLHLGAHAYGYNKKTLGICVGGDFDKFSPAKDQYESLLFFCQYLINEFNLNPELFLGHCELPNTKKTCPGINFNMSKLRSDLQT